MIPKIVLTGGPCAGKSTCLRRVAEELGSQVCVIREAATTLLEHGFPPPGSHPTRGQELVQIMQETILTLQRNIEMAVEAAVELTPARVILCDRGVLDGAAYWPGGLDAFVSHF